MKLFWSLPTSRQRPFAIKKEDDNDTISARSSMSRASSSVTLRRLSRKKVSFAAKLIDKVHPTEMRTPWEILDTWYDENDIRYFRQQTKDLALCRIRNGDERLEALSKLSLVMDKIEDDKLCEFHTSCVHIPMDEDIVGLERRVLLPRRAHSRVVDKFKAWDKKKKGRDAAVCQIAARESRMHRRFAQFCGAMAAIQACAHDARVLSAQMELNVVSFS